MEKILWHRRESRRKTEKTNVFLQPREAPAYSKFMKNTYKTFYLSPLGAIEIVGSQNSILSLEFADEEQAGDVDLPFCLNNCLEQIDEYFNGKRKKFSLKLDPSGTRFQKSVWRQVQRIPYGSVTSYGKIAGIIGQPTASRAVGNADGKNPIAIIIPCHRVVGSDGNLTGYGGGLWRKEWLIEHERDVSSQIF